MRPVSYFKCHKSLTICSLNMKKQRRQTHIVEEEKKKEEVVPKLSNLSHIKLTLGQDLKEGKKLF